MTADRCTMLFGRPTGMPVVLERRRVDALFTDAPVTLVIGDRGSGKTSAVVSWSLAADVVGVWMDVSSENREVEAFWAAMDASIREHLGDTGMHPGETGSPRDIVRRALSAAPSPRTIVVDGVDKLRPETIDDIIGFALEGGTNTRVVLIGRAIPAARSVSDVTRSVAVIDADQLALTFDEVSELLRAAGVSASPGTASFLQAATDGVPLLVAIVARALGGQQIPGERLSALQSDLAISAVERAVVPRDGLAPAPSSLGAIRAAALLVDGTVDELASLVEMSQQSVRTALDDAALAGWGRWVGDDDRRFAFAPSIARALAFRLHVKRPAPLLSRAARTLSERGEGMRALMLAFDAEDDELILRTGSRHVSMLLTHHRQILVRLERIPRQRVIEHPLIAFATAACQAQDPRSRVASLANWARAEQLSRSGAVGGRAVDKVVLLVGRSAAFAALGRYPWSAAAAESAVELMEELPIGESAKLLISHGVVYGQAASARFWAGDVLAARQASGRAVGAYAASSLVRHQELTKSSLFAAVDGDIHTARMHLQAARLRPTVDEFYVRAIPELVESLIAIERGDSADARRLVDQIGPWIRASSLWSIVEDVYALADILDGRSPAAIIRLQAALLDEGNAPLSRSDRSALASILALTLLASGDTARIASLLGSLGRTGGSFVVKAAVALAGADELTALMEATTGLSSVRTVRVRVSLLLIRAAAALRVGRSVAVDRDTAAALATMRERDVWTPWLLLREEDRTALLDRAEQRGVVTPNDRVRLRAMSLVISSVRPVPRLTGREHAVLLGVFARETNTGIATRLGISPNTVKKQRAGLYRKLGVSTWEDAVKVAVDLGILDAIH